MKTTEKQREASKARYRKRVASGKCVYCPNPAEAGHIRCSTHREIVADYVAGVRDIRKLKGICTNCGKEKASEGLFSCRKCRLKVSDRYYKQRGAKQND